MVDLLSHAQADSSPAGSAPNDQPLAGYPIATEVFTTRQRTVVPDAPTPLETIFPYEISKYESNGYGQWHYGPGSDAGKQLAIMPETYTGANVTNTARLMNFFAMTDIHITDEESPVQAIYAGYKGGNSSAYSPVIMLSTQVLDAAIQTINALHQQKPFDFGLSLGDDTNGAQYNELRWFIDVMDGQAIIPDSGGKDDPVAGDGNDYQDAYQAAGLDPSIPWYQVLGNHDHAWLGSYPVTDYLRKFYTGTEILLLGDLFTEGPDSRTTFMGALNGSTPNGDVIGAGLIADFTVNDILTTPTVAAADPDRRPLSRSEWMNEFFTTTSNPPGHGFSQGNVTSGQAHYTFEPKADIPLKVIVLDDTQTFDVETIDEEFEMYAQGYLNQERYDWLVGELDKGQAEGKLMIISAHVPLALLDYGATHPPVTLQTMLLTLSAYPNLILWISGHAHRNVVTPRPSVDPAHTGAEYGFWEVETSSLRDFPQQFRMFEILRNSDRTLSIMVTDVDPAVEEGSLAAQSRIWAVASSYFFSQPVYFPPANVYNAELVKQLSPQMQTKIQECGTPLQSACTANVYLYE